MKAAGWEEGRSDEEVELETSLGLSQINITINKDN